jgi:hypothetical protein
MKRSRNDGMISTNKASAPSRTYRQSQEARLLPDDRSTLWGIRAVFDAGIYLLQLDTRWGDFAGARRNKAAAKQPLKQIASHSIAWQSPM